MYHSIDLVTLALKLELLLMILTLLINFEPNFRIRDRTFIFTCILCGKTTIDFCQSNNFDLMTLALNFDLVE